MTTKKAQGNKNNPSHDRDNLAESERLPLQQCINDFIDSGKRELVLPGLSNAHRKYLHKYAARKGLKTASEGNRNKRVLHITQRKQRITTERDAHKLELTPESRHVLPALLLELKNKGSGTGHRRRLRDSPSGQQKQRLRGAVSMKELDSRMVPPRPMKISNELNRDKQELPIYQYQNQLHEMLRKNSIFIINGETGSGKTTQVPQYILSEATRRNCPCRILVTQPRRVAAVSVAHRVAEERGEQLGDTVGYQIRMESRIRKSTNLIYTTSGCLLRSIMGDMQDLFRKVTHLIIDEIHERDKYTDFTLITLKEQLQHNKDLKVILMSATMDINLLSKYFDDCPVLNVPGQGYDVKIYHLEDILFHTGYRTALMEKYLRCMKHTPAEAAVAPGYPSDGFDIENSTPVRLVDEYLQELLDSTLDQCCDSGKSDAELCEIFDQIQYYIESEGMPVDAGHGSTGMTPLMAACKCNFPKYVQLFMQRQASIYLRDVGGFSPVDYALQHPDRICMRILENSGFFLQQQVQISQEDADKKRLISAYQKQFNDDNDVDHDLILSLLEGLYRTSHPGAIMVFLPGYNDIVHQRDLINSTLPSGTYRICILHGQMDSQDQFEALQCQPVRKIILSTNIGQTSITIPDLAYIIDSGKVKMKTYDSITECSQLQPVWISQADACQRSGRAGRTQNGVCYRLYSQAKFNFMPKFCFPEFMRIPLTEICLYAKTLDSDCDVQTYLSRSLNSPSPISIQSAIRKLQIMEIFNEDQSVTELGRHLVELPMDVQLGKCLLYGIFLKCFDPVVTIVAYHSVKDPFVLPTDRATQGHASFQRKSFAGQSFSDQMGILSLYKNYTSVRNNRKRVREFCSKYFLSQSAMEIFYATRRQISDLVSHKFRMGCQVTIYNDDWNMVRFCLVAGFYPNIAFVNRTTKTLSSGADKHLVLQRTSSLNPPGMKNLKDFVDQMPHDWIVYFEKSRLANMCSINMNTVVSPIFVALQCGRECTLEEEGVDNSEESETYDSENGDENGIVRTISKCSQKRLDKKMSEISIADYDRMAVLSLDNWIKFAIPALDAKMLLELRSIVQKEFLDFLHYGHTEQSSSAAQCVQKFLNSLDKAALV